MKGPNDDSRAAMGAGQALFAQGVTFAVFVAGCVWGGHWLDGRTGSGPLFMLLGLVLGLGLGGFWLYQRLKPLIRGGRGPTG